MNDVVIQVEGLSKQYRLGEVSTGSLGHDLNRWWHRIRGKEDPYLSITGENIRTRRIDRRPQTADRRPQTEDGRGIGTTEHAERGQETEGARKSLKSKVQGLMSDSDYVWALRDINFEVRRGEVLGIIGRNGAGKSTLLKILSRITAPTTGEVRVDGRIASLLEVGTGFHQDLTGRENIFLNGAILGMTKREIQDKLDEIVDFSGCAAYLDTPVKRYSSGMVVRLGFAVAAHLEPEILIVDEVLAVGDAEFQKKCIGKMQDVASHGRTVLFVSHNMGAVSQLCSRAIVVNEGEVTFSGKVNEAIDFYYQSGRAALTTQRFRGPSAAAVRLKEFGVNGNYSGSYAVSPSKSITITGRGSIKHPIRDFRFFFGVSYQGIFICSAYDLAQGEALPAGEFETSITIPAYYLRPGNYELSFGGGGAKSEQWFFSDNVALLSILEEYDHICDKNCHGVFNLPRSVLKGTRRVEKSDD